MRFFKKFFSAWRCLGPVSPYKGVALQIWEVDWYSPFYLVCNEYGVFRYVADIYLDRDVVWERDNGFYKSIILLSDNVSGAPITKREVVPLEFLVVTGISKSELESLGSLSNKPFEYNPVHHPMY